MVLDKRHVIIERNLMTDVELVDIVNPVFNVHLAISLILQKLRIELDSLKHALSGL